MIRTIPLAVLSVLPWAGVFGQSTAASVEFEVASITTSPPPTGRGMSVGCSGGPGSKDPGLISCENVTLSMLVTQAYNVSFDQMVALDWMAQQKFDIVARVPARASAEKVG